MAVVAIRTDIACPPLTASTVQIDSNSKQSKNSCVYALQIAKIGVTVILNSVDFRQPNRKGILNIFRDSPCSLFAYCFSRTIIFYSSMRSTTIECLLTNLHFFLLEIPVATCSLIIHASYG